MSAQQKRWSYKEITTFAEASIRRFMASAQKASTAEERMWYRACAYGAYMGWYHLTCGWQENGDSERLDKLTQLEAIN
jgi:hypothetical protein